MDILKDKDFKELMLKYEFAKKKISYRVRYFIRRI